MPTIRARKAAILRLMDEGGMRRQRQLAQAMGLAESTISRQLNGCDISPEFVAGCLQLWPDVPLDALFEVIDETGEEPAAA